MDAEADDPNLEVAAVRSRLPPAGLTELERRVFVKELGAGAGVSCEQSRYLFVRNSILALWLDDCRQRLTAERCVAAIFGNGSTTAATRSLTLRVHRFLERYGYINFGVFASPTPTLTQPPTAKRKVIVVGAGIAGLAAARQLDTFGFDVLVLEARARPGGRICTYTRDGMVADLGAMVVTGMGGNPLVTISRQIPMMKLNVIQPACTLYDSDGRPVDKHVDDSAESKFNTLLDVCAYLGHTYGIEEAAGRKLSFGGTLQFVTALQEKAAREARLRYLNQKAKFQARLCDCLQKEHAISKKIAETKKLCDRSAPTDSSPPSGAATDSAQVHEYRAALRQQFVQFEQVHRETVELEECLKEMTDNAPGEAFLSDAERRLVDWHSANLEFANSAPLCRLSLKHWNQDDENEFVGNHLSVQNGFACVADELAKLVPVHYRCPAVEVFYGERDVRVICSDQDDDGCMKVFTADAVLCAVPLGVLKASLDPAAAAAACSPQQLRFLPPLPSWKADVVRRLGFGNLNKVALFFNAIFWNCKFNMFGNVNATAASRGEHFLFWTLYDAPVLICLMAGEAADVAETLSDDVVVGHVMHVLRKIFGEHVPSPLHSVVTRWKSDPWSRGSYSYVAVDASGQDYDTMAAPVSSCAGDSSPPRLFFAGEHTCREHPATAHGAFLSGTREAARIAKHFIGEV